MNFVLIVHVVQDYPAWKDIFDEAAGIRRSAGEVEYHLLRDERDPNRVVHFSRWTSLTNAREFFESPELEVLRSRAGVKAPTFSYLITLEHTQL